MNVLIQINISQKLNKNGASLNECEDLATQINSMTNLKLRGIMAMPTIGNNIEYQKIHILFCKLKKKYPFIDTLSLGTSADIKESLLANSNMIRIGQAIFHK